MQLFIQIASVSIHFGELPEDMQVILCSFLDDRGIDLPDVWPKLPIVRVSVNAMYRQCKSWKFDYRGMTHVEHMIGQALPPIIVENGKLLDGRHRILAAHQVGTKLIDAIDLTALIRML